MEVSKINGYDLKDKKAIRFYNTVDDMKNDSTLKEGMHVKTKGYYSVNDESGSEYIIVNNSNLVSDNGSIHDLTNGLKAQIINNEFINLKQFGGKGDGVNNDTSALINALNYSNLLGIPLYIPSGKYKITESITLPSNTNIYGCNKSYSWLEDNNHSVLYFELSSNKTALKIESGIAHISNLSLLSNSCRVTHDNTIESQTLKYVKHTEIENVNGLDMSNANAGNYLNNISILGFSGYGLKTGYDGTVNNIYVTHCGLGIECSIDTILSDFRIQFCEYGLSLKNGCYINSGRIEEISKHGLYIKDACVNSKINNVFIDQCGYAGIGVYNYTSYNNFNVKINRCCSYYSDMTISQILNLTTIIYEACAKIYIDNNTTFLSNRIHDEGSLKMQIDDNNEITVTPYLIYSISNKLYGYNKIFIELLDSYVNNDNIVITNIADTYAYLTNNLFNLDTTNGYMYIEHGRNVNFLGIYRNQIIKLNNIQVRNAGAYTGGCSSGDLVYIIDNGKFYVSLTGLIFPIPDNMLQLSN